MNNCIWCKSLGPHVGPCRDTLSDSVDAETSLVLVYENTIIKMSRRIAELEAEVASLKPQDEMTYPEALKALQEMADFIKQQSATDFEEGEG